MTVTKEEIDSAITIPTEFEFEVSDFSLIILQCFDLMQKD